jgi:hypothetical protein
MDLGEPLRMMRKANGNSIECVGYTQLESEHMPPVRFAE